MITYEVVVERDAQVEVHFPEPGTQIAGFRIIDLGRDPDRIKKDRIVSRRWYQLRADLVGSYILPAAPRWLSPARRHEAPLDPREVPANGAQARRKDRGWTCP